MYAKHAAATAAATAASAYSVTPGLLRISKEWLAAQAAGQKTFSWLPPYVGPHLHLSPLLGLSTAFGLIAAISLLTAPNRSPGFSTAHVAWRLALGIGLSPLLVGGTTSLGIGAFVAVAASMVADGLIFYRSAAPVSRERSVGAIIATLIACSIGPQVGLGAPDLVAVARTVSVAACSLNVSSILAWSAFSLTGGQSSFSRLMQMAVPFSKAAIGGVGRAAAEEHGPVFAPSFARALTELRDRSNASLQRFLLVGPAGCGKSTGLVALAQAAQAEAYEVPFWHLVAAPSPAYAVHQLFVAARARHAASGRPIALLFDTAEACFPPDASTAMGDDEYRQRHLDLIGALMNAIEGADVHANDGLIIAAAAHRVDGINKGIWHRFSGDMYAFEPVRDAFVGRVLAYSWAKEHQHFASLAAVNPLAPTADDIESWCDALARGGEGRRFTHRELNGLVVATLKAANVHFAEADDQTLNANFGSFARQRFVAELIAYFNDEQANQ